MKFSLQLVIFLQFLTFKFRLIPFVIRCICFQLNIRTGSYDPLDKAYKENKQLIQAYRTRMQNSNRGGKKQDVMSRVRKFIP